MQSGSSSTETISTGSRVLDDVAEVIGLPAALKLSWHFRGQDIYVPKNLDRAPEIVEAIGREAAEQLADLYGGIRIAVPQRAGTRAMVLHLAADGTRTRRQIAAELGIGERLVYRILQQADDRQLPLAL